MTATTLIVNGRTVAADIEPRQHLADYLRERELLTGTHLGCEHGICGACTVLIDGVPARSCIAFPVALDGAAITTVEGLADDPVAARLREAFKRHHALQCGFCTPGMLVMARDIVLRRPGAGEATIRLELSGNLCRCTGYVGIVRAVAEVAAERLAEATVPAAPSMLAQPVPQPTMAPAPLSAIAKPAPAAPDSKPAGGSPALLRGATRIEQSLELPFPPALVWAFFQDPEKVVACVPGARLTRPSDGRTVEAEMVVALGPIRASFSGQGEIVADADALSGSIAGGGSDKRSATQARGHLAYRLQPKAGGAATTVGITLDYALQGPLAQLSRGAIARDLAGRLTAAFAANVAAALSGTPGAATSSPAPLAAGGLIWAAIRGLIARLVGKA